MSGDRSLPDTDLHLGKVAVDCGFLSDDELDQAIEIQEAETAGEDEEATHRSLGSILVEEGFLDEEELNTAIARQQTELEDIPSFDELQKKQILYGKLAVKSGYCSEEELQRCLQIQGELAKQNERKQLGQIMVEEEILTPEQARELLRKQSKRVMECEDCDRTLNVVRYEESESYRCPSCGGDLLKARRDNVEAEGMASHEELT